MQFTRTNILTDTPGGKSMSSGGIILEGNQGGSGGDYVHPTGWLWGNKYTGRETLDGDLTSNGTITANTFNGVNANITYLTAENGSISSLNAWDALIHRLEAEQAEMDEASITDATIQNLWVTGSAHFAELIIDKINSTNGAILVSPAHAELSNVHDDGEGNLICSFKKTDGDKKISNDFQVGDLVLCQQFNVVEGVNQNVSNKFVWKRIIEVHSAMQDEDEHWFKVKNKQWLDSHEHHGFYYYASTNTNDEFAKGDEVCVLGNQDNLDRQQAVLISSTTNPWLKIAHAKEDLYHSPYMGALGTTTEYDRTFTYLSFKGITEDMVTEQILWNSTDLFWTSEHDKKIWKPKPDYRIDINQFMRYHNFRRTATDSKKSVYLISLGGGLVSGYNLTEKAKCNKIHIVLYYNYNRQSWCLRMVSLIGLNYQNWTDIDDSSNNHQGLREYVPITDEIAIDDSIWELSDSDKAFITIDGNGFEANGVRANIYDDDYYTYQDAYDGYWDTYAPARKSDCALGGVLLTDNRVIGVRITQDYQFSNSHVVYEYLPNIASEQLMDNPYFDYGLSAWTYSNVWVKYNLGHDISDQYENAILKDNKFIEHYHSPNGSQNSDVYIEQTKTLSPGKYILDFDCISVCDDTSQIPSGVREKDYRNFQVRCFYGGGYVAQRTINVDNNNIHKYKVIIQVENTNHQNSDVNNVISIKDASGIIKIRIEATGYQNWWGIGNVTLYKCDDTIIGSADASGLGSADVICLENEIYQDQYGNNESSVEYKCQSSGSSTFVYPCYIGAHNDRLTGNAWNDLEFDYTTWNFVRNNIEAPAIVTFDNINTYSLYNRQVSVMSPKYNLLSASSVSGLDGAIKKSASFELLEDQISMKVNQSEFNTLSNTVTNQGTLISQNASAITLKADKTTVNTLSGEVSNLSSTISQTAAQVAINVSSISQLNGDVSSLNSSITVLSDRITLNSSAITSLNGSVSTLESEFSVIPGQISSIVSSISSLEGEDVRLWSSISQLPTEISAYVYNEIDGDLTQTGIDITNHQISLTADNFIVKNNNNNPTLYLNSQGLVESRLGFVTNPRTGSEETFNPTFYALSMERQNNDPLAYSIGLSGFNKAYQGSPVINQNPDYTDSALCDFFKVSTDIYNRTSDLQYRIPILTMQQDDFTMYDSNMNYIDEGLVSCRTTMKLQPKELSFSWNEGGTPQLGLVKDLDGNMVPGIESWVGGVPKCVTVGVGHSLLKDASVEIITGWNSTIDDWISAHSLEWSSISVGELIRVKKTSGDRYSTLIIKELN